jgi:3-isopropylmalate/(R)-2-methylmalate dehydratase small subunit
MKRNKVLKGKAWVFGNNINTDDIIAARYLITVNPSELGKHCLEGVKKGFPQRVKKGDFIVAGENFGCGSSREHAPWAIKGAGISAVIAKSFARIFFRNAINIGLPILELRRVKNIKDGDLLHIDLSHGKIRNITQAKEYDVVLYPAFMQQIIDTGGLINWVRKFKI